MIDTLILYERKNREFENCLLLQVELESRGFNCVVSHFLDPKNYNFFNNNYIKVLVVPHLYNNKSVYRNLVRFGKFDHIINLQYEQVLSDKWEKLGHHNPKGIALQGFHVCWGKKTSDRMVNAGVRPGNSLTIGAIQNDLLRKEFRVDSKLLKREFAEETNLPLSCKWTLFLSSFTYANISPQRLKLNESVAGIELDDIVPLFTNSRDSILEWISGILAIDKENLFIYRPHPDELNLEPVKELERNFENFRIIDFGSAKQVINVCDKIYTWYSTTIVEAQLLEKPCFILRPIDLPSHFDSVLLKNGSFVKTFQSFKESYFSLDASGIAVDWKFIEDYYLSFETPSYKILCDKIVSLYDEPTSISVRVPLKSRVINKLKMYTILLLYYLYKSNLISLQGRSLGENNNFFVNWLLEMKAQFVSKVEYHYLKSEIIKRLTQVENERKY